MGIYSDLSDQDLAAEITAFRTARRDIIMGAGGGAGAVKRITDGDRTLEYTAANLGDLDRELLALIAEQDRRLDPTGKGSGRAIQVEFD